MNAIIIEPVPSLQLAHGQHDVLILYAEEDINVTLRFQEILKMGSVKLKTDHSTEVCLLSGFWKWNSLRSFLVDWNRSDLAVFALMNNVSRDTLAKLKTSQCITGLLYRPEKHISDLSMYSKAKRFNKVQQLLDLNEVWTVDISEQLRALPIGWSSSKSNKTFLDKDHVIEYRRRRRPMLELDDDYELSSYKPMISSQKELDQWSEVKGGFQRSRLIYRRERDDSLSDDDDPKSLVSDNVPDRIEFDWEDIIQGRAFKVFNNAVPVNSFVVVNTPVTVNNRSFSAGGSENWNMSQMRSNKSGIGIMPWASFSNIGALQPTKQTSSTTNYNTSPYSLRQSVNHSSQPKTTSGDSVWFETPSGTRPRIRPSGANAQMEASGDCICGARLLKQIAFDSGATEVEPTGPGATVNPVRHKRPVMVVAPLKSGDDSSHVTPSGAGAYKGMEMETKETEQGSDGDKLHSNEDPDETRLKRETLVQTSPREMESEEMSKEETEPKRVMDGNGDSEEREETGMRLDREEETCEGETELKRMVGEDGGSEEREETG